MEDTKKTEIKKIKVMSLAKITAFIGLIIGLIFAIILFILTQIMKQSAVAEVPELANWSFGPFMLIWMPLYYLAVGFISGLLSAWLYNLVVKWVGGIKLDLVIKK